MAFKDHVLEANKPKHSPLNKLAFFCLVASIAWIPIPFASVTLVSELGFYTLIGVITILYALSMEPNLLVKVQQRPVLSLLAFSQLIVALQFGVTYTSNTKLTLDLGATQIELITGIGLTLLFWLCSNLSDTTGRVNVLLGTIFLSGVAQSCYGSLMITEDIEYTFFLEKAANIGVATGTFINRNHFAAYLCLTLASGIGLLLMESKYAVDQRGKGKIVKTIEFLISGKGAIRVGLIVITIGILLTRSRMGNMSFAFALTGAFAALIYFTPQFRKKALTLVASIALIDIILFGFLFDAKDTVERIRTTSIETENRADVYSDSGQLIKDHFLFGSGAGTFYTTYPAYQTKPSGNDFFDHAHNDYIELLSERGIFGAGALAIFMGLLIIRNIDLIKSKDPFNKAIALTSLFAILALLSHALTEFNLQIPAYAATFIAMSSLAYSRPVQRRLEKEKAASSI